MNSSEAEQALTFIVEKTVDILARTITPQMVKCLSGEHESIGIKVPLELIEYGHICKHCRCLYVAR